MAHGNESRGYIAHTSAPTLALVWVMSHAGVAHGIRPSSTTSSTGLVASSADAKKKGAAPTRQPGTQADDTAAELSGAEVLNELFAANPELLALVREAAHELERAFGERAKIVVEPYVDPEVPWAEPRVFVIAVTSLPFEQADQILDTVLDGWWADNQSRASYLVSLATELV